MVGDGISSCNVPIGFTDALTFLRSVKRHHLLDFFFITKIGEFQGEQDFSICCNSNCASLVAQRLNHLPAMRETWVQSLGWEDPLEKGKATHSSTLAWRIPGTIQSMESQRIGHNRATFTLTLCLFTGSSTFLGTSFPY